MVGGSVAADVGSSVFVDDSPSDPPHEAIKANVANMTKDFRIVTLWSMGADGSSAAGRSPSGDHQHRGELDVASMSIVGPAFELLGEDSLLQMLRASAAAMARVLPEFSEMLMQMLTRYFREEYRPRSDVWLDSALADGVRT